VAANALEAELTATERTAVQRYTFPATAKANVLLNAGQALHKNVNSKVEILDDRTVRTDITGSGFCRPSRPYTVYTVTRFIRPPVSPVHPKDPGPRRHVYGPGGRRLRPGRRTGGTRPSS
jgi:putative alpha-1,2-mannosidase